LAELYYKTVEKLGCEVAETWYFRILNSNLIVSSVEASLAKEAGIYKIKYGKALSLAGCFAMLLAVKEKAVLLTTDRDSDEVKEVEARHFSVK